MMRKVLLSIPPALSTLLFCAHLLYHGVPLAAGRSSCEGSRRAVRFILRLKSWRA